MSVEEVTSPTPVFDNATEFASVAPKDTGKNAMGLTDSLNL